MDSLFQFYPTNKDLNKYTYHKAHHQIPTSLNLSLYRMGPY